MVTVASYNLENLFSRPKAFNTGSWAEGEKITATGRGDRIGWLELTHFRAD